METIKNITISNCYLTKKLRNKFRNPQFNQSFDGLTFYEALIASLYGYCILNENCILVNIKNYNDDGKNTENNKMSESGMFHIISNNNGEIDNVPFTYPSDWDEPIWSVIYPYRTLDIRHEL